MSADRRLAAAERLLAERGIAAEVSAEGSEGEIAAIRLSGGALEEMLGERGAEAAAGVKALGFRYVAVDLA